MSTLARAPTPITSVHVEPRSVSRHTTAVCAKQVRQAPAGTSTPVADRRTSLCSPSLLPPSLGACSRALANVHPLEPLELFELPCFSCLPHSRGSTRLSHWTARCLLTCSRSQPDQQLLLRVCWTCRCHCCRDVLLRPWHLVVLVRGCARLAIARHEDNHAAVAVHHHLPVTSHGHHFLGVEVPVHQQPGTSSLELLVDSRPIWPFDLRLPGQLWVRVQHDNVGVCAHLAQLRKVDVTGPLLPRRPFGGFGGRDAVHTAQSQAAGLRKPREGGSVSPGAAGVHYFTISQKLSQATAIALATLDLVELVIVVAIHEECGAQGPNARGKRLEIRHGVRVWASQLIAGTGHVSSNQHHCPGHRLVTTARVR
mmetsp:Transcript_83386/g.193792  ORF Transcript_83386/g.193792 Transcript_83386/m.193792 type:complete len:368 (+) Transcript_83386:259-1362(+)